MKRDTVPLALEWLTELDVLAGLTSWLMSCSLTQFPPDYS
jgi:hypothetical protein